MRPHRRHCASADFPERACGGAGAFSGEVLPTVMPPAVWVADRGFGPPPDTLNVPTWHHSTATPETANYQLD